MSEVKNITQSGIVKRGVGKLIGLIINSHSSGTLKAIDGLEAGVAASGVLTSAGACAPADYAAQALTSDGTNFKDAIAAQGTITLTGIPIADETMVIAGKTYTFKAARSGDGEITIGANAAATVTNIVAAITADSTNVTAVDGAGDTVVITAAVAGTAGNALTFTEAATNTAVDGAGTLGTTTAGVEAETITIDTIVYTFKDTLAAAYDVKIGANAAASLDNLKAAINASGTAGTEYFAGTEVHPTVIATTNTDTVQTIRAKTIGTAANSIATTETASNAAWGAATMAGGVAVTNATITIGTRVYTAVLTLPDTIGLTAIPDYVLWVTSEAVFLDNLKSAINASGVAGTDYSVGTLENYDVVATTNTNTAQTIVSRKLGTVGNAIATTDTLANYSWGAVTLESGTGTEGKLILNTITFSAVATTGERFIPLYDAEFNDGLYVVVGGTADVTLLLE